MIATIFVFLAGTSVGFWLGWVSGSMVARAVK